MFRPERSSKPFLGLSTFYLHSQRAELLVESKDSKASTEASKLIEQSILHDLTTQPANIQCHFKVVLDPGLVYPTESSTGNLLVLIT